MGLFDSVFGGGGGSSSSGSSSDNDDDSGGSTGGTPGFGGQVGGGGGGDDSDDSGGSTGGTPGFGGQVGGGGGGDDSDDSGGSTGGTPGFGGQVGGGGGGDDNNDSGGSTGGTPGFGGQTGSDTGNADNPDSTGGTPGVGSQTGGSSSGSSSGGSSSGSSSGGGSSGGSTGGTPGVGGQVGQTTDNAASDTATNQSGQPGMPEPAPEEVEDVEQELRDIGQGITEAGQENVENRQEDNLAEEAEGTPFEMAARNFESGAFTFGKPADELGGDLAAVGNVPAAAAGAIDLGQEGGDLSLSAINPNESFGDKAKADARGAVEVARNTATAARRNPDDFVFRLALGAGTGVGTGSGAGSGIRSLRGRARTRGLNRVDSEDLTNQDTLDNIENPQTADSDSAFPGFDDEQLDRVGPAEAFRQQADEFTPEQVQDSFTTEGTDVKKALDVEPEADGDAAFETQGGGYESPGGFVGPELSPNFLRLNSRRSADFSLRPGLPDTGGSPTGVVIRTDVEGAPEGVNSLDDFNEFLRRQEGDTTARTKPEDAVNPGEAEAVIPEGAEFVEGRQDFFTVIADQRVPIRTAERADVDSGNLDADSGRTADEVANEFDQPVGTDSRDTVTSRQLDDVSERPTQPVDRPTPVPSGGVTDTTTSQGGQTSDLLDSGPSAPEVVYEDLFGSPSGSPGGSPGSPPPSPTSDSQGGSSGFDSPGGSPPSPPFGGSGGGSSPSSSPPSSPSSSSPPSPGSPGSSGFPSSPSPDRRRDRDPSDDDEERLFDEKTADIEDFTKQFSFNVASAEEILSGELDGM